MSLLRFALPSALGAAIFLLPVSVNGSLTIPFSLLTDAITGVLGTLHDEVFLAVLLVGAAGALAYPLLARTALGGVPTLRRWFDVQPVWVALRLAGALIAAMVYLQVGPEAVIGPDTGTAVLRDICMPILVVYIGSAFCMGLLTDYGLMEFVGELFRRPFTRLFRLPGRAAVDAVASFVSAAGVGLLITVRQYELGRYTVREAAVICCSFSVVSLPFALIVARVAGVDALFVPWYLTIAVACVLAAFVVARVGPVAAKADTYHEGATAPPAEQEAGSALHRGLDAAQRRATDAPGLGAYFRSALVASVDYSCGLLGPIMVIATVASVLVFRTPVFDWLAAPLVWALDALRVVDAALLGKGALVGFLDQFMPALVAQGAESGFTRFLLAGLSVSQLVYMSEYGLILLRSPLPISFADLLVTFVLRTVIVTPVLCLGALLFAGA